MNSLVIIEDHPVMRRGLAAWFAGTGRWQVLGIAGGLEEARSLFLQSPDPPGAVLLDLRLQSPVKEPEGLSTAAQAAFLPLVRGAPEDPRSGTADRGETSPLLEEKEELGLDIIPWLRKRFGKRSPPVVVYTQFDDYAHVNAALGYGARGYVCKYRGEEELENALLAALRGEVFVDQSVASVLKKTAEIRKLLTRREAEVLNLVKEGMSNKRIAVVLGISVRTVENLLSCIYIKTGIESRYDLRSL